MKRIIVQLAGAIPTDVKWGQGKSFYDAMEELWRNDNLSATDVIVVDPSAADSQAPEPDQTAGDQP